MKKYLFQCCSDTHGIPPPPLPESGIMAWLHAGDFYNGVKASSKKEADRTLKANNKLQALMAWLNSRTIPFHCVAGNHDCSDPCGAGLTNGSSLAKIDDGLFLVSLGWHGECYYDLPKEADLQKACADAMNAIVMKTTSKDKFIVLSHWPASLPSYGSPREGYLSKSIYQFCRELKPLAAIEGHVDGLYGTKETNEGTLYVVCGPTGGTLSIDLEPEGQPPWDQAPEASFDWGPAGSMVDYLEWRNSH